MGEEKDLYLEKLYEIYSYSNTEFDKNILFISSGALGLTVTFIDKIVPLKASETAYQTVLFVGWLLLTGSIIFYIFSHRCSKVGTGKVIKKYKQFKTGDCTYNEVLLVKDSCNRPIVLFNNLSSISMVAGILCVLIFIYLNITP